MNLSVKHLAQDNRSLFLSLKETSSELGAASSNVSEHPTDYTIVHTEGDAFPSLVFPGTDRNYNVLRLDPFLRRNQLQSISRVAVSSNNQSVALIARDTSREHPVVLLVSRADNSSKIIPISAYDLAWSNSHELYATGLVNQRPQTLYHITDQGAAEKTFQVQNRDEEITLSSSAPDGHVFVTVTTPTRTDIFSHGIREGRTATTPVLQNDLPGARCVVWNSQTTCLSYKKNVQGEIVAIAEKRLVTLLSGTPQRPLVNLDTSAESLLVFSSTGTATALTILDVEASGGPLRSRNLAPLGPVTTLTPTHRGGHTSSRYTIQKRSFLVPTTVIDLDEILSHTGQALHTSHLSRYVEESIRVPASNGSAIPVSLVRPQKPRGLLIKAYGAYGVSTHAEHDPELVALLSDGIAVAIAHVRGGGELGPQWHNAATENRKMNSVDDLVAATHFLQRHLGIAPGACVAEGRSAGGWLVAKASTSQPELLGGIILDAPLLNIREALSDPGAPLYDRDHAEWGGARLTEFSVAPPSSASPLPQQILITIPAHDTLINPEETLRWALQAYCSQTTDKATIVYVLPTADHLGPHSQQEEQYITSLKRAFIRKVIGYDE